MDSRLLPFKSRLPISLTTVLTFGFTVSLNFERVSSGCNVRPHVCECLRLKSVKKNSTHRHTPTYSHTCTHLHTLAHTYTHLHPLTHTLTPTPPTPFFNTHSTHTTTPQVHNMHNFHTTHKTCWDFLFLLEKMLFVTIFLSVLVSVSQILQEPSRSTSICRVFA